MSTINPFVITDYLTDARTRYTTQFFQKDIFDRYIQLLLSAQISLQLVFQQLMQNRSLDTAIGSQLDLIGLIVGQSRILVVSEAQNFFGFDLTTDGYPYSSLTDLASGGTWASLNSLSGGTGNITLDDDTYRLVLKARILANISNCTPEEVINSIKFLLGTNTAYISETGNAHLTLGFSRTLSTIEQYLITGSNGQSPLIPIPAGVAVEYIMYDENGVFGFLEDPNAFGFADYEEVPSGTIGYGQEYGISYGGSSGTDILELVGGGTFATIFF